MTVNVDVDGQITNGVTVWELPGGEVVIAAADPDLPRIDVVYAWVSGVGYEGTNGVWVERGTPATAPVPSLNGIPLAYVFVEAGVTAITGDAIVDRRMVVPYSEVAPEVRNAAGVPTAAPGAGELPFAADTTASPATLYFWNGSAWLALG